MDVEGVDEVERPINTVRHPIAYAGEPVRAQPIIRAPRLPVDDSREIADLPDVDGRVGNTDWCRCFSCVPMTTHPESLCCLDDHANMEHLIEGNCITTNPTFKMLCLERDVLEVSLLSLRDVRAETLERPISSR